MKNSKSILLAIFATFLIFTAGCATTGKYTEMSNEVETKEVSDTVTQDKAPQSRDDEQLLGDSNREPKREYPTILQDDLTLIELADQTGMLYTVYFNYDSYTISSSVINKLKKNANWVRTHPDVSITIEGHADERGSNEYNLALGQRRASSVSKFFVDLGVKGSRLKTISYGEEKPAVAGHDETAWSKNRRVEFIINK